MKTIFTIIPSLGDGGGERLAIDLSIKLQEKGYNIYIISLYGPMETINSKLANDNQLKCIYLNKKRGIDFKLFFKVRKILKKYKPDVVHTHLDTLLYVIPFLKKKHKKFHTIHSMAEKEAWGFQKFVRKIAFKVKKVKPVAISDTVCESISLYYKISKIDIPIIYNAIDTKKYMLSSVKKNEKFTLINVGTLYEVKNQSFLIRVFNKFHHEYPNSQLLILGDGPLKQSLNDQIMDLGLYDAVKLVGKVTNVWDYLALSNVFVITSKYEGLPLSMIEAMASGLPIISTNVGGVKDVIIENENGYLFELDDEEKIYDRLCFLLNNKEHYEKIRKYNIKKAMKFDIETVASLYIDLYNL